MNEPNNDNDYTLASMLEQYVLVANNIRFLTPEGDRMWDDINELFPTVVKNTFKFPKESCKEEKKVEAWGSSNVFARSGARIFEISNMKKIVKEFCKINKLTEFYHG